MPKVSIIMPIYNTEKYVKECLESIVNQTLQDIELICVDDGSTDNSGKILDEYAAQDKRIKVIHKINEGYGKAMNVGFDNTTGEYIGIVEPDDYIELNMYESLYNIAKKHDVDFVKADFQRFVGEKNNRVFYYDKLSTDNKYYNTIINIQEDTTPFLFKMNTWAGIYNREFLVKHNIRHNETPGASFQDNGFWFQTLCYSQKAYFLNKPFYNNRRDNPNSSVKNKAKVFCMKEEYDFIYKILEENNLKEKFLPIFQRAKYSNYMFTLNRIDVSLKKLWIEAFAKDFQEAFQKNEIDFSVLNCKNKAYLKLLIKNPTQFYIKYKKRLRKTNIAIKNLKERFYREITRKENSKIVFWGASVLLENFLQEYKIKSTNILGIIDKNPAKKGSYYCGYKISTPESLKALNPQTVLISVVNVNRKTLSNIKKTIKANSKQRINIIAI